MTPKPYRIDPDDLLELEQLISRRNSISFHEYEPAVRKVRIKEALAEGRELDAGDIEAPEEPWYLEARVMTLEAEVRSLSSSVRYRMPNLREFAFMQPCQIRLPRCCIDDPETSVLCHIRRSVTAGASRKPCDLSAFIGCYACHVMYDSKTRTPPGMTRDEVELAAFDGMIRTHELYRQEWGFR